MFSQFSMQEIFALKGDEGDDGAVVDSKMDTYFFGYDHTPKETEFQWQRCIDRLNEMQTQVYRQKPSAYQLRRDRPSLSTRAL